MRLMRRLLLLFCICICFVFLSGCEDRAENSSSEEGETMQSIESEGNTAASGKDGSGYAYDIYVSPDGDDAADGTSEHPVQTVGRALSMLSPGYTVYLEDGTYYESVRMPSGKENAPVTLCAVHPGEAMLTTAVPFSGEWQETEPHIYRADLSGIADRIEKTNFQLFCDGDALVDARYPNIGPSVREILTAARGIAGKGTDAQHIVLSEEIGFPTDALVGARVVVWPGVDGMSAWDCASSVISAADGNVLTLEEPITGTDGYTGGGAYEPAPGNAFFLVGAKVLLDAPGEYWYDAENQAVYCRFPDDASPDSHTVAFRGKNNTVINCGGKEFICLSGLRIFGGGVSMRSSDRCVLSDCGIFYADHASFLTESAYSAETATTVSGSGNRIERCEIAYTAFSGLTLSGSDTVVADCYIHDTDYVGSNFAGIFLRSGERLEISHNTIENSGRIHIYMMAQGAFSECRISNNLLSCHSCLTSDCGAVYTWSTDGGGTEICYNRVFVTTKNTNGAMSRAISGIYLDNYCSDFRVYRNVISGDPANTCFGLQLNLTSSDTLCANNTVADCTYAFAVYGYPNDEADASSSRFVNNLFVHNTGDVHYNASECGVPASYYGALKNGTVPVPLKETQRFQGSNNLSASSAAVLDADWMPAEGKVCIDAGTEIEGITDGFSGNAPDVGALESGTEPFSFGARSETSR